MTGIRRPPWFDARAPRLARRLAWSPLVPLAWLYGAGAWTARRLRERGAVRLPCRVVSVGNLVAGGTGKTPAAAAIASQLRARGYKVAIASRGWGRRGRESVTVVSDGRFVRAAVTAAGDEPLLLAAHAPGVPVLVGADRALVGRRAIAAFGADVLVLDDGFQHRRLARDVDLVCFDGSGLGSGRLLPRGPLREPVGALAAADAVLVVDGPLPREDEERIAPQVGVAKWFGARRVPVAVRPLAGGDGVAPAWLAGRRIGLLAGIARPASFRRTLEASGARVAAEATFPDHHRYRERDLAHLDPRLVWVTTEKDALKILPSWVAGRDVRVLVVTLAFDDGAGFVDWLDRTLRAKRY